jgi:hypothetical protein
MQVQAVTRRHPKAGATSAAISSSDRRMNGCGGSTVDLEGKVRDAGKGVI